MKRSGGTSILYYEKSNDSYLLMELLRMQNRYYQLQEVTSSIFLIPQEKERKSDYSVSNVKFGSDTA